MNRAPRHTNRLIQETSPYLRQHAHNPVDWYAWGPEALDQARRLNRPIFLSIGYSACHWCHVMEHESFEDPAVAQLLNDHFISIKVDREERPDLDQIYMTFVQMQTGHGGWPMTVFLTPEAKPFYGGTYFPPDDRYQGQLPSFARLVRALADAWKDRHGEVLESASHIAEQLQAATQPQLVAEPVGPELLQNTVSHLRRAFDSTHGGFGRAPKFPHSMDLRVLLRVWKRTGDSGALDMVRLTLDRMAMGGMYDHLGGGFHRYSTDAQWLVPHFEKMLYDNALLTLAYLEGYQAMGDPFYRTVAEETLGWVLREMTSPAGPFWSTQDADSEGMEGKFYVWSAAEIEEMLGKERAEVFEYVYGVSEEGNWEGHNILHRTKTFEQCARMLRQSEADLHGMLDQARQALYQIRSRRIAPGRDEKVLTSWNGLMIAALAQAAQVLGIPSHVQAAEAAADFIVKHMRGPDGRLRRTWSAGTEAKLNAYLEDYAFLIDGLVSLYEATFAPQWIESALELTDVMIEQFEDPANTGFFFTGRNHEQLIARVKELHDGATPSGNSMAVTALLRLARLTGRRDLQEKAEATLCGFRDVMAQTPSAAGQMLTALDFHLGPVAEFAVIGAGDAAEVRQVLRAIHRGFRPNKVVAVRSSAGDPDLETRVPLLQGKTAASSVTTWICRNFTCQAPLVGVEAAEAALAEI